MPFEYGLYFPWCRHLESFGGLRPQPFTDNMKRVSDGDDDFYEAAWFTNTYIRLVGQTPAPGECVLLRTSSVVRALMKDWVLSDAGDKWTVKLDGRVLSLFAAELVVMALLLGFSDKLRILRTKFMPGALHAIEGSRISFCLLQVLRTALVAVSWSKKMPLAHVGLVGWSARL